uniref:Putative nuclease HARBI1 n=1 Tax=Anthurium amnicola TaxID=1678845 RepID=A0A1D1ZDL7_9ARAE
MQSSYMKIPHSPTSQDAPQSSYLANPGPPLPNVDDYSDCYAFFQDAVASLPPAQFEMPDHVGGSSGSQKRKRGEESGSSPSGSHSCGSSGGSSSGGSGGGAAQGEMGRMKKKKTVAISELITSLAMMEEQEKADRREWESESQQDIALFEANHKQQVQAMSEYYGYLQDHYADTEESEGLRAGRARVAAAVVAASDGAEKTVAGAGGGGGGAPSAGPSHHHRRLWVKDRSRAWWDRCNHPDFPEEEFRKAFRMGRATFDMICDELGSAVAKEDTMLRAAIPVRQRVAVCIWRLATGEPLRLVSKRFGLGISTCHKLVLEVCAAIKSVLMPKFLQWPPVEAAVDGIKARFEAPSGIPNVVGAMYTTHIPIIAPKISVAAYFNKRHTERNQKTSYSITIQGVVDPDGVFTDVCIGWPGSMSDDQVLEKSALHQRAASGMLHGQWVVGGSGYPLLDWVLVPYAHQNLTWTQHAFNEKIGEVQRVAREAFARLKGRWKCLQKRTEVKLQDLPGVLGACCVLHNICEMNKEEMDPELNFELVDDEMISDNSIRSMSSMQARESIAHNLLHHGLAGTAFF